MNAITEPRLFFDYDLTVLEKDLREMRQDLEDHEIWEISKAIRCALSPDGPYFSDHGTSALLSRGNGHDQTVCVPLVIANVREHPRLRREFTLHGAVRALLGVYRQCHGMTSVGVLLTDVWRPSNLKNHEYDLRTALQRGTKTVPLLISGRLIRAVKMPWE